MGVVKGPLIASFRYWMTSIDSLARTSPVVVEPLEAAVHRAPDDLPLAAVGLSHRRVDHQFHGGEDVETDAVAAEFAHDRVVADHELAVLDLDQVALGNLHFLELRHARPLLPCPDGSFERKS